MESSKDLFANFEPMELEGSKIVGGIEDDTGTTSYTTVESKTVWVPGGGFKTTYEIKHWGDWNDSDLCCN